MNDLQDIVDALLLEWYTNVQGSPEQSGCLEFLLKSHMASRTYYIYNIHKARYSILLNSVYVDALRLAMRCYASAQQATNSAEPNCGIKCIVKY